VLVCPLIVVKCHVCLYCPWFRCHTLQLLLRSDITLPDTSNYRDLVLHLNIIGYFHLLFQFSFPIASKLNIFSFLASLYFFYIFLFDF
jgi:hypothetical protein